MVRHRAPEVAPGPSSRLRSGGGAPQHEDEMGDDDESSDGAASSVLQLSNAEESSEDGARSRRKKRKSSHESGAQRSAVNEAARFGLPAWRAARRREIARDLDAVSAATRAARWTKYPALAQVEEEWLAARRIPGRLGWPHQWKQRAAARDAAAREDTGTETGGGSTETPTTERGASRVNLRRARAQPDAFSYDENPRKRAKKTAAAEAPPGHRKRRLTYMDGGDGRGF